MSPTAPNVTDEEATHPTLLTQTSTSTTQDSSMLQQDSWRNSTTSQPRSTYSSPMTTQSTHTDESSEVCQGLLVRVEVDNIGSEEIRLELLSKPTAYDYVRSFISSLRDDLLRRAGRGAGYISRLVESRVHAFNLGSETESLPFNAHFLAGAFEMLAEGTCDKLLVRARFDLQPPSQGEENAQNAVVRQLKSLAKDKHALRAAIPYSSIESVLSISTISKVFADAGAPPLPYDDLREIHTRGLRLLAISLLSGCPDEIQSFLELWKRGIFDDSLPLKRREFPLSLGDEVFDALDQAQRVVLRPFRLLWNNTGVPDDFWIHLASNSKENELPWSNRTVAATGGSSIVYRVGLPSALHSLAGSFRPRLAVKTLVESKRDQFENELRVLKCFSGNSNPHMINLLMAYEQGAHFNLVFSWAESDLRTFWRNNKPSRSLSEALWMSRQLEGITAALASLHGANCKPEDRDKPLGRHGDLKPENILYFRGSTSGGLGTFVIADFGLSRCSFVPGRPEQCPTKLPRTPAYAAPEGLLAASYDIWTLGCVFLEFATWLLLGQEEQHKFNKAR